MAFSEKSYKIVPASSPYTKTEPSVEIKTAYASAAKKYAVPQVIEPSYNKTEPSADVR